MSLNNRQILDINVKSVEKRYFPIKHYVYGVLVTWPDSTESKVFRKYSQFCDLKRQIDKNFDSELNDLLPESLEKNYLGRYEKFSETFERKENINKFCKKILIYHQTDLCCSEVIMAFFEPRGQDLRSVIQISLPIKTQEYFCTHDFNGESESELTVFKNQKLTVHQKNLNGWWFVSSSYGQGYVPQIILRNSQEVESESEIILVKNQEIFQVTRDYKKIKHDEIDVKKGDFVRVIEKRLNGWWKIENKGRIGLAPAVNLIRLYRKNSLSSSESLDGSANSEQSSLNSINLNSYHHILEEAGISDILVTKL